MGSDRTNHTLHSDFVAQHGKEMSPGDRWKFKCTDVQLGGKVVCINHDACHPFAKFFSGWKWVH
jgi:hypothetical protein